GGLRQILSPFSGSAWTGTDPRVSGVPIHREEAERAYSRAPYSSIEVLLLQDAEASLPDRGSAVSESAAASADDSHAGRGDPANRRSQQSVSSRHADDRLHNRHAPS